MAEGSAEARKTKLEDELEHLEYKLLDLRGLHTFLLNAQIEWPQPNEVVEPSQVNALMGHLEQEKNRVVDLQHGFQQTGWERQYAERVTIEHLRQLATAVIRQGRQPWQFVLEEEVRILVQMQLIQNQLLMLS